MNQLISVIIPVYNVEKYLPKCLDSVLAQTYKNLEILLIDDGATDASGSICDEFAQKDSRVVCRHKPNGGVSSARNLGLSIAHGEYIHFLDADDYLEPDAYETLLTLAQQHQCDAVVCEYFATYPDRETRHSLAAERYGLLDNRQSMYLIFNGIPFTVTRLFHRSLVEGVPFDEGIARGEDGLFNVMALHRARSVYFTDRALYHYVQSEQSAVRGRFRPSQLTAMKLLDVEYPFISEHYPELAEEWMQKMGHLLVMLYYDMFADESDYTQQMQTVHDRFRQNYKQIIKTADSRNRMKFGLFRHAPKLFCKIHREYWKTQ